MADVGRVAGDEHERACSNKGSSTRNIAWDVSSVTTMYQMFRGADAFNQISVHGTPRASRPCTRCSTRPTRSISTYRDGTSARSRPCRRCSTTPTHSTRCRWAGTHPKSRIHRNIFLLQRMVCEVRGRQRRHPPRQRVDAHRQRVRRVPSALNGAVGNCTDTLVSGDVLRPHVRPRVRAEGRDVVHRPGA